MFAMAVEEWPRLLAANLCLLIGVGASLYFPKIAGDLVADAVASGIAAINATSLLLLGVFLLQGLATVARHYLFVVAGFRIVTNLRRRTFDHLMKQEIAFFDQRKTGELLSRLSEDCATLMDVFSHSLSMGLRGLATVIGGIALMMATSTELALQVLIIVPPLSFSAVWFARRVRAISRAVQDAAAVSNDVAEESLSGIRIVRAFTGEQRQSKRYSEAVFGALAKVKLRGFYAALFQGVLIFIGYGVIALILWSGGRKVVSGEFSIDVLLQFVIYALMVAFSLSSVGGSWASINRALGAAHRVFEILDRQPHIPHSQGHRPEKPMGALAFEDVSFAYPSRADVRALRHISLQVEPGEIIALVGPSGSGKSTLASLIPRFYDPDEGLIRFDGHALTDLDPLWLRNQIGIVPQEPDLFSSTIGENIAYGKQDATDAAIIEAAKAANAHDFIINFPDGYNTEVGERGVKLSGGQKQRIAIARAILRDPRVLILDEATSAMDAESEHLVKQALDRLMVNRTTLIIAHRLSTVKNVDRVIALEAGAIVEIGAHHTLMQRENGLYRRLLEHQLLDA